MKICNILLAVALFLSVGIIVAVAEEPADEDTRRDDIYTFGNSTAVKGKNAFTQYFYNTPRSNPLTITLPLYKGIAETESGRSLYSVENRFTISNANADEASYADNEMHVYDFDSSFDDSVMEKIGFIGRYVKDNVPDPFLVNARAPEGFQSLDNGTYAVLAFDKKVSKDSQNRPKIMSDGSYLGDYKETQDYSASPYSAPMSLLLLLICFCIILVMHTTTEVKWKD